MKKVRLQVNRAKRRWAEDRQITAAPPYVFTNHTSRAHRIRSATIYNTDSDAPRVAYNCWCGQTVLDSERKRKRMNKIVTLTDTVPNYLPICGTCEGRAIGAGHADSHEINGRFVVFSPRY